jgi:hypothetical protein
MKQTAVEWFAKQVLSARQLGFISNEKFNELLEQAKEMEKEQIIQASCCGGDGESEAEEYYEETFKLEQ